MQEIARLFKIFKKPVEYLRAFKDKGKKKIEQFFDSYVKTKTLKRAGYNINFSRDGARVLPVIIAIQAFIIFLLIVLLPTYLSIHKIQDLFFPSTQEGRIVPNTPLSEPNIGTPHLVSWMSGAISDSLNLSFNDYERRLRKASGYFTRTGWSQFTSFLNDEKIMRRLQRERILINTQPTTAPVVIDQGIEEAPGGKRRYFWKMRVSLRLQSRSETGYNFGYDAVVKIVRVPKLENGLGISIDGWSAQR